MADDYSFKEDLPLWNNTIVRDSILSNIEKSIIANHETSKSLIEAPNYYAWITIAPTCIFLKIQELVYNAEDNIDVFDWGYRQLLNYVFNKIKHDELQINAILEFAKIRHLLAHKGFPDPHRIPSEGSKKSREIATNYKFDYQQVHDLAKKLRSPSYFAELKAQYMTAVRAIDSLGSDSNRAYDGMAFSVSYPKQ